MENQIKQLQDLLDIQCSYGNWNYDPYMHGMANGMILAMSLLKNEEPVYLDAPAEWLCDKKVIDSELLTAEDLIKIHPELSDFDSINLLEFAKSKTIHHKSCYGDGSIIYPMWLKEVMP